MPKPKTIFRCAKCDSQFPTWQGRCPECGSWGTLEAQAQTSERASIQKPVGKSTPFASLRGREIERFQTGLNEVDRVLGGGLVPGSVTLISGEPGIGKSTLVIQIASQLSKQGPVLYVSGEESGDQVKLRLDRLGLAVGRLQYLGETNVESVLATVAAEKPKLAIIDSIQTMTSDLIPSEAGTVGQVRTVTLALMEYAKQSGCPFIIIGHVTKEGTVAGPKTLEHLVDAVLALEGDSQHAYRLLRSTKNRFGSTNEVGVFSMEAKGLVEVPNPSALFLEERPESASGSVVTATVEGSRAWLVEVQALVNPTVFGLPRRTASGIDFNRLQLILAVLGRRLGFKLGALDVFVNVVGGFKLTEPAADLAIAAAVASAVKNHPVEPKTVLIGEVGLAGELRSVPNLDLRVNEALRLGFTKIIVSAGSQIKASTAGIIRARTVGEALRAALMGGSSVKP